MKLLFLKKVPVLLKKSFITKLSLLQDYGARNTCEYTLMQCQQLCSGIQKLLILKMIA